MRQTRRLVKRSIRVVKVYCYIDSDTHDPEVLFKNLREDIAFSVTAENKTDEYIPNAGLWLSALICVFSVLRKCFDKGTWKERKYERESF